MRLELSRKAQADLDDIRDFSVEQFGVERAILYLDAIEQAFRLLLDHPNLGSASDLGADVRSIAAGEHRAYYRIEGQAILVARVLHKAMDVERWV